MGLKQNRQNYSFNPLYLGEHQSSETTEQTSMYLIPNVLYSKYYVLLDFL